MKKREKIRLRNCLYLVCGVLLLGIVYLIPTIIPLPYQRGGYATENVPLPDYTEPDTEPGSAAADAKAETELVASGTESASQAAKKKLYLVLDDAGYSIDEAERFLTLPIPLTVALLPYLPYTHSIEKLISRYRQEYILHFPMEPLGKENPGTDALQVILEDDELMRRIRKGLDVLTDIQGINNHMGSRATADMRVMNAVFRELEERQLFFLDSRTTTQSVAREVAQQYSVPLLERHLFLDNIKTKQAITDNINKAEKMAEKNGYVIMLGHVGTDELYEVLNEQITILHNKGFIFGFLSELVRTNNDSRH